MVKKNCSCCKTVPPGEIANQILNPLTTIKGFLQLYLLKMEKSLNDEVLHLLLNEINKIETIVNDLENNCKKCS
ncbi:MAG: hypothetical protein VR72_01970 [Clostridiaceae bacterium BRH_c20a]|nr:MAG: hypothetical protein VR72_01970 [Clostridiaceae bacterium BRH_c20a]